LRRAIHGLPQALQESRLTQINNIVDPDFLVLEPVSCVQHHAETERRVDADIEMPECQFRAALARESPVDRCVF